MADDATITLPIHSAVHIEAGGKTVWFDPYDLTRDYHDADAVFITHDHFDHLSPDDIERVRTESTVFVVPESAMGNPDLAPFGDRVHAVKPGDATTIADIPVEAVAAYNIDKDFHPRANGWLGYVVTLDGKRYYVSGDTDDTPEVRAVDCDVAFLPVGGTYTMTADEAAVAAREIAPELAIPTHYGTVAGTPEDGERFAEALAGSVPVGLLMGSGR